MKKLTEEERIQNGVDEAVREGLMEQILDENGEIAYRLTDKGTKYVERELLGFFPE